MVHQSRNSISQKYFYGRKTRAVRVVSTLNSALRCKSGYQPLSLSFCCMFLYIAKVTYKIFLFSIMIHTFLILPKNDKKIYTHSFLFFLFLLEYGEFRSFWEPPTHTNIPNYSKQVFFINFTKIYFFTACYNTVNTSS